MPLETSLKSRAGLQWQELGLLKTTHRSTSGSAVSPVLELESWHFCLGLRVSDSIYFLPTLLAFTKQSRMNSVAFLEA